MKRFLLFVLTNLLVILTVSTLVNLLGLRGALYARGIDYQSLLIVCAVWGFAGSFISLQLSRWMAKWSMGVQVIDPEKPGSPFESRLVDRVRRLCSAANLETLPEIGVYDSPEVNAFATGPSRSRSLLAISTGLLNRMDDRAIDGVLGHEISHIVNGDMVTMTLLQGVANTFVMFLSRVIVFFIDQALRDREDRRGGGLGWFAQYMLIQLLQTVLMLLSSIVIYWFSRQREFGADAGSARLTGRETMIHALEQLRDGPRVQDNRAPSLSAFKIDGHGYGLAALLFASHPPLDQRIEALRKLQ